MPAPKGRPKPANSGRKKGTPNKNSPLALRDAVLESFFSTAVGGVDYLNQQAIDNPRAYLALLAKVLPNHLQVDPITQTVTSITVHRVKPTQTYESTATDVSTVEVTEGEWE